MDNSHNSLGMSFYFTCVLVGVAILMQLVLFLTTDKKRRDVVYLAFILYFIGSNIVAISVYDEIVVLIPFSANHFAYVLLVIPFYALSSVITIELAKQRNLTTTDARHSAARAPFLAAFLPTLSACNIAWLWLWSFS